jgi:hypothetical protein
MIEVALFAIACLATVATLLPFLGVTPGKGRGYDRDSIEDLFLSKEWVYENIRDLDFDHQVGKIDDRDYQAMRGAMKHQAGEILDRIDQLKGGGLRKVLEKEVARHRKAGATDPSCPGCGTPAKPDDRFCSKCGQQLG